MDIPDDIVPGLAERRRAPSEAVLDVLVIDAYRRNRIGTARARTLLEIASGHELDALLKAHGVVLDYTIDDFEREGDTSTRLLRNRRDARQAPRHAHVRPEL